MNLLASIVLIIFSISQGRGDGSHTNRNSNSPAFAVATDGFILTSDDSENKANHWEFERSVMSKQFLFEKEGNKGTYIYGIRCYKSLQHQNYFLARLFYQNSGDVEMLVEIFLLSCENVESSVAVLYKANHHEIAVVIKLSCITFKFTSEIPESEECNGLVPGDFSVWEKVPDNGGEISYEEKYPTSIVTSVRGSYGMSNEIANKKDTWEKVKAWKSKPYSTVIDGTHTDVIYGIQCYKNHKIQENFLAHVFFQYEATEITLMEVTTKECKNIERFIGVANPTALDDNPNYHKIAVLFKHECILYMLAIDDTTAVDCVNIPEMSTDWDEVQ